MSNILYARRTPIPTFYKRRISRILPVFVVFVLAAFSIAWLAHESFTRRELITTLLFLRTYVPSSPGIWDTPVAVRHLWSLNAEEHCYVLLSIVALLGFIKGREWLVLLGLGVISVAISLLYAEVPRLAPPSGALGTEVLASYILLPAGYFLIRKHFTPYVRSWMPVAALLAAVLTRANFLPWWTGVLCTPFLLAFAINHVDQSPRLFRAALAWPGIRLLGIWSYSIYIWQQPFHYYRDHLFPGAAFALAIATGVASFYFFENPLRTWLNKNW